MNRYEVDYTIFFYDDMSCINCKDVVIARNEVIAAGQIENLFDTNDTVTRINCINKK